MSIPMLNWGNSYEYKNALIIIDHYTILNKNNPNKAIAVKCLAHLRALDLIWPLTYLCDLWPQNIMEANVGHLPIKFGYKQMQGWKVIQIFVSVTDRRTDNQTDGRTQFESLSLPPPTVGSTKTNPNPNLDIIFVCT